jgi:5-methylcytosine-specific restriction endonuclease McrA
MAKRDDINAKRRAEYAANPEPRKTISRAYREANHEKVLEEKRRYHQSIRGKISHHKGCVLRRARMAAVAAVKCDSGIHWSTLAEKQGSMTCSICGKECVRTPDRRGSLYPTVDHIIPISKGGSHTWDNVRLACRGCNTAKRDRLPTMVKAQLQEQRQQLSSEGRQQLIAQMGQGG